MYKRQDLIEQIRERVAKKERVLVTTLTKKMAEDLTSYLASLDIKVRYMHSEIKALERMEIIRDLRLGEFDVLVGINLLREGLDIPEVSLVAILDADKEGFLRSERSLIQTIGRAARNTEGKVIMYADELTESMEKAISETNRSCLLYTSFDILAKIKELIPNTQIVLHGASTVSYTHLDVYKRQKQFIVYNAIKWRFNNIW